jgi:hypothetical protein
MDSQASPSPISSADARIEKFPEQLTSAFGSLWFPHLAEISMRTLRQTAAYLEISCYTLSFGGGEGGT